MVLEARSQTRMIRTPQRQMIIHHWRIPSNTEEGIVDDCTLSCIHESTAGKEATNPGLETRAERNKCSNFYYAFFHHVCYFSKHFLTGAWLP